MRINTIKIENVANIKNLFLDLRQVGPGIIALVGANESGKTHLMESMLPTPLLREWPSSKKSGSKQAEKGEAFIEHCWNGKASLEVNLSYGDHEFVLTLLTSPTINKQEAYFKIDGVEHNKDGKLPEYDALVKKFFPSKDVILSAIFATQNNLGSFFKIDREARRALFARLLGVDGYQQYADEANEIANATATQISSLEQRVTDARAMITNHQNERETVQQLNLNVRAWGLQLWENDNEISRLDKELKSGAIRALNIQHRKRRIEEAESSLRMIGPQLVNRRIGLPTREEVERGLLVANTEFEAFTRRMKLFGEVRQNYMLHANKLVAQMQSTVNARKQHEAIHSTQMTHLIQERDSLNRSTSALEGINLSIAMCRRCPLTRNAQQSILTLDVVDFERSFQEAAIEVAVQTTARQYDDLHSEYTTCLYEVERLDAKIQEAYSWRREWEAERVKLSSLSSQLHSIEQQELQAKNHRDSYEQDREFIETEKISIDEENFFNLYMFSSEEIVKRRAFYSEQAAALWHAHQRLVDLAPIMTFIAQEEEAIREAEAILPGLRECVETHTMLSDTMLYMRMATIEDAKPEVERITNEILMAYEEGRLQVSLETSSTRRGSRKEKEDFVPRIYDSLHGVYKSSGSGGQQAIVDEAIRLAMCVLHANQSGMAFETLFRDETTAALTRDNAGIYVQMLRKAQEIGGFHQIIFVTHHESVWKQADAILEMSNGELVPHDD